MNRLETKCLVASAGAHGALFLLLFLAPLIWLPKHHEIILPVITFLPSRIMPGPPSGGSPNARPPAPAPPAPVQAQAPAEPVAPAPPPPSPTPRPETRTTRDEPEAPPKTRSHRSVEPTVSEKRTEKSKVDETDEPTHFKTARKKVPIEFAPESPKSKANSDSKSRARAAAANARAQQFTKSLSQMLNNLDRGLSSSDTSFELPGPGGGGEVTAPYASAVSAIYYNAWILSPEDKDQVATVKVRVVISRSGRVESFTLVKRSGNGTLDRSVGRLENIQQLLPFPEGMTEPRVSFILNFNPKIKSDSE
jgi:TonB family protein